MMGRYIKVTIGGYIKGIVGRCISVLPLIVIKTY